MSSEQEPNVFNLGAKRTQKQRAQEDDEPKASVKTEEVLGILQSVKSSLVMDANGRLFHVWTEGTRRRVESGDVHSYITRLTDFCSRVVAHRLPTEAVCTRIHRVEVSRARDAGAVPVFVRVGYSRERGAVYLDLDGHRYVEATAQGWEVREDECPVLFARGSDSLPLPVPERGAGSLVAYGEALRLDGELWRLCVAFLMSALMPPVTESGRPRKRGLLVLTGEHQSGKTTRAERLLELVDPRGALSGTLPDDARGLAIHVRERWVPLFDNTSGRPKQEVSDALCRLVDGAGFSTRKLHTDDDEARFSGSRCVIVTGIDAAPARGDLASRAWRVELPPIPEGQRMTQTDICDACDRLRPGALAELLDAVCMALRNDALLYTPMTRLDSVEKWVHGAEEALGWEYGETPRLLMEADKRGQRAAGEGDVVVQAILGMLSTQKGQRMEFTSKALLAELEAFVTADGRRAPDWMPRTPEGLSRTLSRVAPGLRALGCEYEKRRDSHTKRQVHHLHLPEGVLEE